MASGGLSGRPTPASTNCLIVGACTDPEVFDEGSKAKGRQERMKESIEADISRVLKFVAKHRSRSRRPAGSHHQDSIYVSDILLNKDMLRPLKQGLRTRSEGDEMRVLDRATIKPYKSKAEVRKAIRDFMRSATADQHLILVMTGHGNLEKEPEIEQAFRIPTMSPLDDDFYSDKELTEDINDCLEVGQRLYILMNACYSGGMLNLWQLDARQNWVALFASAGPTLTSEWSTFEEDMADDEDGARKYDFLYSFFKNAKVGRPLMEIAKRVLLGTQDTEQGIRPTFVTTDPAIAGDLFLVTPPNDED